MKKSTTMFLMACSLILMACQIQYLFAGQPTSAPEVESQPRSTATVKADSYPTQSQPPAGTQMTVTANNDLTMRATASTVAPSVGQLKKGDVAQIIARTPGNDWFQVSVSAGLMFVQGWVPANQVTLGKVSLDQVPVIQTSTSTSASSSSSKATAPTPTRKTYP